MCWGPYERITRTAQQPPPAPPRRGLPGRPPPDTRTLASRCPGAGRRECSSGGKVRFSLPVLSWAALSDLAFHRISPQFPGWKERFAILSISVRKLWVKRCFPDICQGRVSNTSLSLSLPVKASREKFHFMSGTNLEWTWDWNAHLLA